MRTAAIALVLVFLLLLSGCIAVGNCKGRAECYKKTAVYYALKGDKQGAKEWCKKIIEDPDISVIMENFEYNDCIIEVATTLLDKNFCANGRLIQNCEKKVEQEELKQQSLLNPNEAYKHTCPAAIVIFSILPAWVLFMKRA